MSRSGRMRALFVSAMSFAALAPPLEAQVRRRASVQPVALVNQGAIQVGVGFDARTGTRRPLSGLRGDLFTFPVLSLRWGLTDAGLLSVTIPLYARLDGTPGDSALVPLDPAAIDGTTGDFGDASVGLGFVPWRAERGPFAGGRFRVTLPNSDERKGIGINSTEVLLAVLGGWRQRTWIATGSVGVEIIEAPVDAFEQNDAFAYAAEILWGGVRIPWRVGAGIEGRASTRGRMLPGTEDLGEWYVSFERLWGSWSFDLGMGRGYTPRSGGWRLDGGVAVSVGSRSEARLRRR